MNRRAKLRISLGLLSLFFLTSAGNTFAGDEGIKVHGHWKLEITNPDGSLDRVVEFENALDAPGATVIADLLSGRITGGYWKIRLGQLNSVNPNVCDDGSGGVVFCYIREPGAGGGPNPTFFDNLQISSSGLVLSGFVTAANSANIEEVSTSVETCPNTGLPRACTNTGLSAGVAFTTKSLTAPGGPGAVAVLAGQIVQVTVTISFS